MERRLFQEGQLKASWLYEIASIVCVVFPAGPPEKGPVETAR